MVKTVVVAGASTDALQMGGIADEQGNTVAVGTTFLGGLNQVIGGNVLSGPHKVHRLVGLNGNTTTSYWLMAFDAATEIQGVKSTLLFLPNLLTIPLCTWLTSRYGKKFLLYLTAASGLLGNISIYFFYTPVHPWLQILPALFLAPMSQGPWLILPAMQADVADYDELFTGQRREGSFSAIFSWTLKAQGTIVNGLSGLVLIWTGFVVTNGPHQSQVVLDHLKNYYIWIPVVSLLLYLFAISRYELTRSRMQDIRQELEKRRGVI